MRELEQNMRETNRIRFKKKLNDSFEKSVVSFLNYPGGGEIVLGISKGGDILGVGNVDKTRSKIKKRISKRICPQTDGLFEVVPVKIDDKKIMRIIVSCGPQRPYFIKKEGMSEEGCFIRVGNSTGRMTEEMIKDVLTKRQQFTLLSMASPDQSLTFKQLGSCYEEKGFDPTKQFIEDLGLLNKDGYNYAAYLLADKNKISIKVMVYAGTDKTDLIEATECGNCCLVTAVKRVLEKLDSAKLDLGRTADGHPDKRHLNNIALREAVINAVMHNDYSKGVPFIEVFSDRIVVTSHGGLVADLSKEDFFQCRSMPRNGELMRVFRDLEIAGQMGSGIGQILRAYDKSIFELTSDSVSVTFSLLFESPVTPNNKIRPKIKTKAHDAVNEPAGLAEDKDDQILDILKSNPNVTIPEISALTGKSPRTISRRLREYQDSGVIRRDGARKNGCWTVVK